MNPYYSDDRVSLYHARCEEVLPDICGIGLVLTSPPYNLGKASGAEFKALGAGYDGYEDSMPQAEYEAWQRDVLTMLWGTLADDGAIFYNHRPRVGGDEAWLPLVLNPGLPLRQIVIWARTGGYNRTFSYFVPVHEWVMIFAKPAWRLATRLENDVWVIPHEVLKAHPATFPMELARRAIRSTSAQLVLDPFCGSGTTLLAAVALGRNAVGVEQSEKYCEQIATRLVAHAELRGRFPDRFVDQMATGKVMPGSPPRQRVVRTDSSTERRRNQKERRA